MKTFFSIRYKFLIVTTLLLLLCVSAYLFMAVKVFKQDKTELVYDYNRNIVTTLNSDITSLISRVHDRMELYPYFDSKIKLEKFIQNNSEIAFLGKSERFDKIDQVLYVDNRFVKNYALENKDVLLELASQEKVVKEHLRQGESLWSLPKGSELPLIGYNKTIIEYNHRNAPVKQYSLVVLIKTEKLYNLIAQNSYSNISLLSPEGELLIGELDNSIYQKVSKSIEGNQVNTSVIKFKHNQQEFLGAFSRLENGLLVVSNVRSDKAFQAVNLLIYRSVLFASIVLTVAFIVAIFFSKSLTRPIEILMNGMKRVSKGHLEGHIEVDTKDEIHTLAESFNKMIVDLKESREGLEEANRTLEGKVVERTEQLEKQNQAVKMAQEAMLKTSRLAAVGEIAGRAAHEVLNPLTNIINRTQILKNKQKVGDQVQVLTEIRSAWEGEYQEKSFNGLVESWQQPSEVYEGKSLWEEDLLNLKKLEESLLSSEKRLQKDIQFLMKESSRINKIVQSMRSMSKVKNEVRPYDPDQLVTEAVNIMADLASRYNVKIEHAKKPGLGFIKVDFDEFIQSITNLLRNSIQAISEKIKGSTEFEGIVKLSLVQIQDYIEIHIVDNGMGIAEKDRKKLFKTQFTTKSKSEGTGLGLNISRRFIRAFDGDIYLMHSELDVGTTMVIQLPLHKQKRASA